MTERGAALVEVPVTHSLFAAALFGNMRPPPHRVSLPPGSEWVYANAHAAFVAVAVTAAGLWLARRRALRPATGRALLWLAAGSVAAAYSGGWLWTHRDAGDVRPGPAASLAVSMYGFWGVGAAAVVAVGWRRVRGRAAVAGRSFALALLTLAAAWLSAELGFRELALLLVLPGYLLATTVPGADGVAVVLFFGVNVGLWWAVWAFVLGTRQQLRATAAGPRL